MIGVQIKRIAHRGFSSEAPENSYAAFAMAAEADFYGIECDVWKTKDGVYVVSHDGRMARMCGTELWIPNEVYGEIRRYPFVRGRKRTWHPEQHIIRLTEYLRILSRCDEKRAVIELKMDYTTVELREIVDLVKQYNLYDRTVFISLYGGVLLRLKEELAFPPARLQYVYGAVPENKWVPVGMEVENWLIENRLNLDARHTLVSRGNVMRLHDAGLAVNVWTVNRREDMIRLLMEVGVDMVTQEYYYEI